MKSLFFGADVGSGISDRPAMPHHGDATSCGCLRTGKYDVLGIAWLKFSSHGCFSTCRHPTFPRRVGVEPKEKLARPLQLRQAMEVHRSSPFTRSPRL